MRTTIETNFKTFDHLAIKIRIGNTIAGNDRKIY